MTALDASAPYTERLPGHRFSVAPMLDWTDRHCRFFHRQITRHALLYTEMVTTGALIHGDKARHLDFDAGEHPVALQIGGSEPQDCATAARIGADWGYDEINLNCGCPSDRVQSGAFGACLMAEPDHVARIVAAMKQAVSIPVTVKCRIGIDDQEPEPALFAFADAMVAAGVDALVVHARKAWLKGLSPKENRDIPPLDYPLVHRLKARHPGLSVILNGGLATLEQALAQTKGLDGAMLGRAAFQNPDILFDVDTAFFGDERRTDPHELIETMACYLDAHVRAGGKASHVTKAMLGLFQGVAGARRWRQVLSTKAHLEDADSSILFEAFAHVRDRLGERAA